MQQATIWPPAMAHELAPPFPVPIVFPEVDAAVLAHEMDEENRPAPLATEQERSVVPGSRCDYFTTM